MKLKIHCDGLSSHIVLVELWNSFTLKWASLKILKYSSRTKFKGVRSNLLQGPKEQNPLCGVPWKAKFSGLTNFLFEFFLETLFIFFLGLFKHF